MIFGTIDDLEKYKGLHSNLDKAIEFIQTKDIAQLPVGKTEIYDEQVFVNIMEADLVNEDSGIYEAHRRYLDLHVDIEGSERLLICNRTNSGVIKAYSEEDDYELMEGHKTCECTLDNNHFAICMLTEPHKPCVSDENGKIHKAVFKILFD